MNGDGVWLGPSQEICLTDILCAGCLSLKPSMFLFCLGQELHLTQSTQHHCPFHHSFPDFLLPKPWLFRQLLLGGFWVCFGGVGGWGLVGIFSQNKKLLTDVLKVLTVSGSLKHCIPEHCWAPEHQGTRRPGAWRRDVPVTFCRTSHHNITA